MFIERVESRAWLILRDHTLQIPVRQTSVLPRQFDVLMIGKCHFDRLAQGDSHFVAFLTKTCPFNDAQIEQNSRCDPRSFRSIAITHWYSPVKLGLSPSPAIRGRQ